MTVLPVLGVMDNLLVVGVAALVALCLFVAVVQWVGTRRAAEHEPLTLEEEAEAAIELHAIRKRLKVARNRAEIHRNGDDLRQKIVEDLHERRSYPDEP